MLSSTGLSLCTQVLNLGLAKDDVGVRCRALEDIRLGDNKQDLQAISPLSKLTILQKQATDLCDGYWLAEATFYPGSVLTFLLFLIVTRETPGTGFMPSFCIAFLLFFSDRLCLPRPPGPPPSSTRLRQLQMHALHVTQADLQLQFTSFVIIQVRSVIFAVNVRLIVVFYLLQAAVDERSAAGTWRLLQLAGKSPQSGATCVPLQHHSQPLPWSL